MSRVSRTTRDEVHKGAMWNRTIRSGEAPCIRAAAMKSLLRTVSVSARASRA